MSFEKQKNRAVPGAVSAVAERDDTGFWGCDDRRRLCQCCGQQRDCRKRERYQK